MMVPGEETASGFAPKRIEKTWTGLLGVPGESLVGPGFSFPGFETGFLVKYTYFHKFSRRI
jgi:hypothetical protein